MSDGLRASGPGRAGRIARSVEGIRGAVSRFLPPARLTWLALVALGTYGTWYLQGLTLPAVVALPLLAAGLDLTFQKARFPGIRFPDAAIATGLFVALLLAPTVPLLAAVPVTAAAITLRHVLRYRGRPIFNPAATAVVLGAVLFGVAPAWWVSLGAPGETLLIGFGLLLLARSIGQWRLPATFFAVYAPFSVFDRFLFGAAVAPRILVLGALDPSILFFGLFMLVEPRTSPTDPAAQIPFAGLVGLGAVFFPTALPTLGVLVSLLLGNLLAAVLRRRPVGAVLPSARSRNLRSTPRPRVDRTGSPRALVPVGRPSWSLGRRAGTGIAVFTIVGLLAAAVASPSGTPTVLLSAPPSLGGAGGGGSTGCSSDNPSVGSSTLSALHHALGPSVIRSYDASTGTVVFYDPVNQVTVTETDLYEDFGFAEFNGDDFAVSGCAG